MRINRSSNKWLGVIAFIVLLAVFLVSIPKSSVSAAPPLPGAIFTTDMNGTRVNLNQFAAKCDVYLDGGPGPNAPPTAAGLPDGDYFFQVTDPSGKTLLSTDAVKFRQFHVSGGFITGLSGLGNHGTGIDSDEPGGKTIQLCPFLDTPNPGGVYKAWVTPVGDFVGDITMVDNPCAKGCAHGFIDASSKVDNFKVGAAGPAQACLGVYKFFDLNDNGIREPQLGEFRVSGWPIEVKNSDNQTLNGPMFSIATKDCIYFNLAPDTYTVTEASSGLPTFPGTFIVTSNEIDTTYHTPPSDTILVKFAKGDLRHDVFFGNFKTGP